MFVDFDWLTTNPLPAVVIIGSGPAGLTLALELERVADHRQLKALLLEDLAQSTELNLNTWLKRPASQKLAENLFALMSPVL